MNIPEDLLDVARDVMLTIWQVNVSHACCYMSLRQTLLSVATMTFLFYDYFITVDEEILLVWPSRLTFPKVVFFLNRYLPFVTTILGAYLTVFTTNYNLCENVFIASTVIICIVYIIAEVILFMRAYAIWERKLSILVLLSSTLAVSTGGAFYCLSRYIASTTTAGIHLFHSGCLHVFPNRIIWITLVILVCCETLALFLLLIKRLLYSQHVNSHLIRTIYKDGIFYYAFILCTTITNLLVLRFAPSVLHSILCSRLLLHIRGAYSPLSAENESLQLSRQDIALNTLSSLVVDYDLARRIALRIVLRADFFKDIGSLALTKSTAELGEGGGGACAARLKFKTRKVFHDSPVQITNHE
ncbi:hypothetical protein DFH11DRAFT_1741131 [Phellopilus nigrolimitatus]|nr:hypothetical protein DFH11DRAFT_1741131 [Phellopilus nigrolimitatus]